MQNVLLINAHQAYPFSEGRLNATLAERAQALLEARGYTVRTTTMRDEYDVQEEVDKHVWADVVLLQTPVNWMGVPWSFKKYMDLVYTAGMDGRLCAGDGRTSDAPKKNYGMGGTLGDTRYLMSLTFNAPAEAFGDPSEPFFGGKSVDDLFWPMHLNFQFFGMQPLPTFACYDVMKNPAIEADFERFEAHLNEHFPALSPQA